MERFNLILRQFDEVMMNKVEKSSIKELQEVLKDVDTETLQESDAERHQVKTKVDDILSKFI
jgi:hypothetical protein